MHNNFVLTIVCGLPGTGKTVATKQIADDFNAVILREDSIRKDLFKTGSLEDVLKSSNPFQFDLEVVFDKKRHIPEKFQRLIWKQKELVYYVLFKKISRVLTGGSNIVLDATSYAKKLRKKMYKIMGNENRKVFLVECICPEEVLKKRFEIRGEKPGAVFRMLKEKFEDPLKDGKPILVYDTGMQTIKCYNFLEEDQEECEKLKETLGKLVLKFA
jgi:predicted kinase